MSEKLLKKHQKTKIRFQNGDFILYEPNKEQYQQIVDMVSKNVEITDDMNIKGEIIFENIKFIIRELTSVGKEIDDYSDEELQELLENGDRQIKSLITGITELLEEVSEDIFNQYFNQIKTINNYLKVIDKAEDFEKMKKSFNKLAKANKLGITFDDLKTLDGNDEKAIDELIKKVKKK